MAFEAQQKISPKQSAEDCMGEISDFFSFNRKRSREGKALLTKPESLHDGAVALNVLVLQIGEQSTTLANHLYKGTLSGMIFTVCLHVLRQMGNTVRKQSHLALHGAGVRIRLSVLAKDLFLLFRI